MLHAHDILYWYSITNHKSCIIHTPVESSTRAGTSTRYKDLVLKVGGDCRLWGPVSGFRMHWHSAIGKPSYLVLGLQVHTEDNYFEIRVLQYRYRTCFVYVLRWGRTIERYSAYSTCSMEYGPNSRNHHALSCCWYSILLEGERSERDCRKDVPGCRHHEFMIADSGGGAHECLS